MPHGKPVIDVQGHVFVQGLNEVEVRCEKDAKKLFVSGECLFPLLIPTEIMTNCFIAGIRSRQTATTRINPESSRSQSIFNIRVFQAPLKENGYGIVEVKIIYCV